MALGGQETWYKCYDRLRSLATNSCSKGGPMSASTRLRSTLVVTIAVIALFGGKAYTQSEIQPVNDLPNPYETIRNWGKLPEGRTWGSTAAVDIDRDGRSIWVAD